LGAIDYVLVAFAHAQYVLVFENVWIPWICIGAATVCFSYFEGVLLRRRLSRERRWEIGAVRQKSERWLLWGITAAWLGCFTLEILTGGPGWYLTTLWG
jgi:hypothetical protein